MKISIVVLLISMFVLSAFASVAYAQEPTAEATPNVATDPEPVEATVEPPPVLEEEVAEPTPTVDQPAPLVNDVTALIAGFAGLLSSIVINLIKQIPGLSEGDKSKLNGAAAEVIAVVVGIVTGLAVALVAQGLGLIGDSSLRTLVISLAAPIVSEIRYRLAKLAAPKVPVVVPGDFPVHTM